MAKAQTRLQKLAQKFDARFAAACLTLYSSRKKIKFKKII